MALHTRAATKPTGVYDIITAGPFGQGYLEKGELVWSRDRHPPPIRSAGETGSSRVSAPAKPDETTPRSGRSQTNKPEGHEQSASTSSDGLNLTIHQDTPKGSDPRGSITFTEGRTLIRLFEKADLSTVLHEGGHLFLVVMRTEACRQAVHRRFGTWA